MIDFFQRLDNYLKYKGLNDNKLTIETGISNGLIGKARKRGSISQENISKILYKYSELDANWLLTGTGSMLKTESVPHVSQIDQAHKELADARLEVIDGLKFKIAALEQMIKIKDQNIKNQKEILAELQYMQQDPFLHKAVAEPAPELVGKKKEKTGSKP